MTTRTDKLGRAGTFINLVSFGLVAAAIVISFGVGSFLFLDSSKENLTEARVGKTIEAKSIRPDVLPHTDDNAASIAVEAKPPSSIAINILPPAPAQSPLPSDTPGEDAGTKSNSMPASPDRAATTAMRETPASPRRDQSTEAHPPELSESRQPAAKSLPLAGEVSAIVEETSHASLTEGSPTVEAHPPELSISQHPLAEPLPVAAEVNPTSAASGSTIPAVQIPDEEGEGLFRGFQIDYAQHTRPDQTNIALHETAPGGQVQNRRSYDHLRHNADFRSRVRRECAPITDPELRRHCIASFSTHYR
jgi:hypothetical protein